MKHFFRCTDDRLALRKLIKSFLVEGEDKPVVAQMFVGVDDSDRAAVILHFDDAAGKRDFETIFFSSTDAAKKAFAFLKSIDVKQIYSDLPF